MFRIAFLLVVLFNSGAFENINNTETLKHLYETNLNSSIELDRDDRSLRNTWAVDFQVKRVNITTKYRMQMSRHKQHSFKRTEYNSKWIECVFLYRRRIRKSEKDYYIDESECLTTVTAGDNDRIKAVEQVEKETRKWRRSYRYLVKTCNTENPEDEQAAESCLVRYMEKDKYNKVIQRLIQLKLDTMAQLYLQLQDSLKVLEECLKTQLSVYLEKVRSIMETLNKCYNLSNPDESQKGE